MSEYIPKVYFIHAWLYDRLQRANFESKGISYPTKETIQDDVAHVEKLWDELNKNDKIIRSIIDILGVNPGYDFEFFIYGKGRLGAISSPLMMCLYPKEGSRYSDAELLEVAIHEVLHRFIASPRKEKVPIAKKYWKFVKEEKYTNLSPSTQSHILLYAVLQKLRPLIFTHEQVAEINLTLSKPLKDGYREAIDMVKEDPDFFIKEFTDRIVKY